MEYRKVDQRSLEPVLSYKQMIGEECDKTSLLEKHDEHKVRGKFM